AGATLSTSFSSPSQQNTALNRNGNVLFKSSLAGGDVVGSTNNEAWYTGTTSSYGIMVRKGDVVLGTGEPATALGFVSQMDNAGRVLFDLTLGGPATTANDKALFIHTPGSGNSMLLREGDSAPGTVGATFGTATGSLSFTAGANDFTRNGKTLMAIDLTGGDVVAGVNDRAIYELTESGHTLVSRRGDAAPDLVGLNMVQYNNSAVNINASGKAAFQVSLDSGNTLNDSAIITGTAGNLHLAAREGDIAPGTGGAATFGSMFGTSMAFNDKGQILFTTTLNGVGAIPNNTRSALYFYDPNDNTTYQVARAGQSIEVAPGDVRVMTGFGFGTFNNTDGAALGFGHDGKVALRVSFADSTTAIVTFTVPEPAAVAMFAAAGLLALRRRR
ncbi:MAG: PEP-CTERM sorting domain-containing protein, partial [Phycisphaerales bacterium]|nr:PEP-CTERM sorting domain-containing protein [Phycisphaerales bacterium]